MLATGDVNGEVRLIDEATCIARWSRPKPREAVRQSVRTIDISPNGAFVVTVNKFNEFWSSWDCVSGLEYVTQDHHNGERGCTCKTTRSGHRIVLDAACPTGAHVSPLCVARFSPCGQKVASAEQTGAVIISDVRTGKAGPVRVGALVGEHRHHGCVDTLSFSGDGTLLASAGYDGYIRVWDTMTGALFRSIYAGPLDDFFAPSIHSAQFCPTDNRFLASTTTGRDTVQIWNVNSGELVREADGARYAVYSPDGRMIATTTAELGNTTVELFHAETGEFKCSFDPNVVGVSHLLFSLDGSQITVFGSYGLELRVFDSSTGGCVAIKHLPPMFCSIRIKIGLGRDWLGDMQRREAFAMGHHPRLGATAPVLALDAEVIALILRVM